MGMLYAWATPEYVMWHMTIGQAILLHNHAVDIRNPKPEVEKGSSFQSAEDVKRKREELVQLYGAIDGNTG
jgi:hypothetical protein